MRWKVYIGIRVEAADRAIDWYAETFRTWRKSMILSLRDAITEKETMK